MDKVEIVPVHGLAGFLTFCKLPRQLYAGANGFAPSLDAERWTLYGHKLNPHFQNSTPGLRGVVSGVGRTGGEEDEVCGLTESATRKIC